MPTLPLPSIETAELPASGSLSDFSSLERKLLWQSGETSRYVSGDRIIDETEAQTHLHFLIDGKMQVYQGGALVADLFPGHLFGEMAVLNPPHATASVIAAQESMTWRIHRDSLRLLMEAHPETGAKLMRAMAKTFGERL